MTANPFAWPFRAQYALGFALCAALLGYALYSQYQLHVEPCPLCIFQRVAFMGMGLFFLLGALHGPKGGGKKIYGLLVALCGLVGAGIASRHIWLQHLPKSEVPDCGPGLSYMLDAFPLGKTLTMVLTGSGECAEVNWTFLGLAMPTWTLLWFLGLALAALWAAWKRRDR
jgi:disulfide bond formation protein DsbB